MSTSAPPEVVYTPESPLRHPWRLVCSMVRDLVASRELAWRLLIRDISAQYRQTALGYLWAVLPPLVTSLVFILLNSANVIRTEGTSIPYPLYVIMGTVFFSLFVDSLHAPLKLVNSSKGMLVKTKLPREALLLSAIGQALFSFGIKLVLLVATLVIFAVEVKPTAPLALVPLAGLLLMGAMLGVFLAPLGLLYQDVAYGLTIATTGIMFLSPVVYPPAREGLLAKIMSYNPLTSLLISARDFILSGFSSYSVDMLMVLLATLILLFVSWVLFRLALPIVIERLGA